MAESGEEEMAASWWGGFLQSAKEKSMAALDMVRKDLTEFGTTMQNDAGHVVELTSSTLKDSLKTENTSAAKEKMSKGFSFLERLSQALVVPPDDEGQIPIIAPSTDQYDRIKARIHAIQLDPGTYLKEPSGAQETYSMWCEGFDLEDRKGEIPELLVSKAEVRALYTKLVPSQVSHVDFWRRYFYKLHQMDVEQARKEALMKRADISGAEDSISWDDDWSGDEAVAEDSGSDWEKLPRPGHHRHSPSPSPSPPLSPVRAPTSAPSEQSKDSQKVAPPSAEISQAEGAVEPDREDRLENRSLQEQERGPVNVAEACGPEQVGRESSEASLSSAEAPVPEGGCGEAVSGSPPYTHSTDTFKDYLQLTATAAAEDDEKPIDSEPAESERRDLSVATPVSEVKPSVEEASPSPHSEVQSPQPDLPSTSSAPSLAENVAEAEAPREEEVASHSVSSDDTAAAPSQTEAVKASGEEDSAGKEVLSVVVEEEGGSLKTTDKGDLVVVGSDHGSPVSNASGSKGLSDVDDEWEQDLDIELTEEDMKEVEDLARKLGDNINLEDDDWESWE